VAGIYIHIPFCKQACHYCDFHFSTRLDLKGQMTDAIVKEVQMQKDYLNGEQINTIYFGGGTPSLLDKEELGRILHSIENVGSDPEITVEANPDDLSPQKLRDLRSIGISRLSIGIQSFQNEILKFFNRVHNAEDSVKCLIDARAAGFDNISIDLIYGVPDPSSAKGYGEAKHENDAWLAGIEKALSFKPEHISAYSLTIEERTVFGKWKASNKLTPMNEDTVAEQFEMLMEVLTKNGYDHYEISNFGLPGFHSKHNSSYWSGVKYLGVGPSAHSYNETSRQFNVSNNSIYIKKIGDGEIPFEREELSQADKINESLLIGLRTSEGCSIAFPLSTQQSDYITQLVTLGNASFDGRVLKLTNKGKLLADKIASDLFVSSE
jgi:oxygen-independent coproporphyrinogen-3 oxidase